jgi:hypothetical protein
VAFAGQLDHHAGTQDGVLLLAADPLEQLSRCPFSGGEGARVERHEYRLQGWGGRLAGALVGGGEGPLADRFGVAGRHAQPVAGDGLAQRRPGGAEFGGGGVDAAELLGELEGMLGLSPVGEEPAGLVAQRTSTGDQLALGDSRWRGELIGSYLWIGFLSDMTLLFLATG